jgi:hypothetical protein
MRLRCAKPRRAHLTASRLLACAERPLWSEAMLWWLDAPRSCREPAAAFQDSSSSAGAPAPSSSSAAQFGVQGRRLGAGQQGPGAGGGGRQGPQLGSWHLRAQASACLGSWARTLQREERHAAALLDPCRHGGSEAPARAPAALLRAPGRQAGEGRAQGAGGWLGEGRATAPSSKTRLLTDRSVRLTNLLCCSDAYSAATMPAVMATRRLNTFFE